MTTTNELTTTQPTDLGGLLNPEFIRELDVEKTERLFALYEREQDRRSVIAYNRAVSTFQAKCPVIEKGDDAHGKSYARLDRIWRTIRPLVAELGLSVTWQRCEMRDGICHVEGTLAHADGHSTQISADTALPEMIRGQNAAQQVGSAETYAKRRALCSALGIVTGDDDDGHAAAVVTLDPGQATEIEKALAELEEFDRDDTRHSLLEWAGVDRVAQIPASKFKGAMKAINARKK